MSKKTEQPKNPNIFAGLKWEVRPSLDNPIEFLILPETEGSRIHKVGSSSDREIKDAQTILSNMVNVIRHGKYAHPLTEAGCHIYPRKFDGYTDEDGSVHGAEQYNVGVLLPYYAGTAFDVAKMIEKANTAKAPKYPLYIINRDAPEVDDFFLGRVGEGDGDRIRYLCHYYLDRALMGEGVSIRVAPFRKYFYTLYENLNEKDDKVAAEMRTDNYTKKAQREALTSHSEGWNKETQSFEPEKEAEISSAAKACVVKIMGFNGTLPLPELPSGKYIFTNKKGHQVRQVSYDGSSFGQGVFINAEKESLVAEPMDEITEESLQKVLNQ